MRTELIQVVLPCYNEATALPGVLATVPEGYGVLVVDNNSTDTTAAVARAHGAHVISEPRQGFGAAVHAGVLAATAEYVAICDGDGSFNLEDLPRLLTVLQTSDAMLVMGRRKPTARNAWPWTARVANRGLTLLIRLSTGLRVHDLGPMRIMRRETLVALNLMDRRSAYPLEMLVKVAKLGGRVRELDVAYAPRVGRSKITGTIRGFVTAVHDMARLLLTGHTTR